MAFLQYGLGKDGRLIYIEQVGRGRLNSVTCPYCGVPLLAKKGQVKVHLAHDGETCRASGKDTLALPRL